MSQQATVNQVEQTGVVENIAYTYGGAGNQFVTIDGVTYVTWFDVMNPALKGLKVGCKVMFISTPGPTTLFSQPMLTTPRSTATLLGVIVKAEYVSVWDGGVAIRTACEYNRHNNTVSDVEVSNVEGLDTCEDEYVELPDGTRLERGDFIEDF